MEGSETPKAPPGPEPTKEVHKFDNTTNPGNAGSSANGASVSVGSNGPTPAPQANENKKPFADIKYYVSGTLPDEIKKLLSDGGGVQKSYLSSAVTLCLAGIGADDNELQGCIDVNELPVVNLEWVRQSVRCGRPLPYCGFNARPGQVFSGVTACFSGLGKRDQGTLWSHVVSNGGSVAWELNHRVTHLVASVSSGMKYYEALKHAREGKLSIVTPDWIVNSLQAGQRSAEAPYHPRLLTLRGQTPVMPAMHKKQRMKPKKLMLPTMENTPASAAPLASSHPQLPTTATAVATTPSPAATAAATIPGGANALLLKQLQQGKNAEPGAPTIPPSTTTPVATSAATSVPVTTAASSAPVLAQLSQQQQQPPPTSSVSALSISSSAPSSATSGTTVSVTSSATTPLLPQTQTTTITATTIQQTQAVGALQQQQPAAVIPQHIPVSHGQQQMAGRPQPPITVTTTAAVQQQQQPPAQTLAPQQPVTAGQIGQPQPQVPVSKPGTAPGQVINSQQLPAGQIVQPGQQPMQRPPAPQQLPTNPQVQAVVSQQQGVPVTTIVTTAGSPAQTTLANPSQNQPQVMQQGAVAQQQTPQQSQPQPNQGGLIQLPQTPVAINPAQMLPVRPAGLPPGQQPGTPGAAPGTPGGQVQVVQQHQAGAAGVRMIRPPGQVMQQVTLPLQPVPQQQPQHANMQQAQQGGANMAPGQRPQQMHQQWGQQPQQQQQQQQWNQQQQPQQQFQNPQQQQQWQQQQQMQQMRHQRPPMTPQQMEHQMRQRQIINEHFQKVGPQARQEFSQMPTHEKQNYLRARNLLIPMAGARPNQLNLTPEQRQHLQNLTDPAQKQMYVQQLHREHQIRQQQILQQQRLQQQQQMQQQQQQGQASLQQQQQWQQQQQGQLPPGAPGQPGGQMAPATSHPSPQLSPATPGGAAGSPGTPMSPGAARMVSPLTPGGPRPTWSGETHPALAQVPRTPQQLQHLQRLQLQRDQLEQQQQQQHHPGQAGPGGQIVQGGHPGQTPQQQQMMVNQQQQQMFQQGQQGIQVAVGPGGSKINTKNALQAMLNGRLQQGGPGQPGMAVGQPGLPPGASPAPPTASSSPGVMAPPGAAVVAGPGAPTGQQPMQPPTSEVSATSRLQMMNQQLQQQQQHQITQQQQAIAAGGQVQFQQGGGPSGPQQTPLSPQHYGFHRMQRPQGPHGGPGGMAPGHMQQQRFVGPPGAAGPHGPRPPGAMVGQMGPHGQVRHPMGVPPGQGGQVGQVPPPGTPVSATAPVGQQRLQFYGHDPSTKLPPGWCLLGCVFHICDYPDDPEEKMYVSDWKRIIEQNGGEVEDSYVSGPRLTHLLCKSQGGPVASQALKEGKRLVTVYWLNDIVVKKKVVPPWKAIHFPMPANFKAPCENMVLTLTGFEGRDRDWVKDMIRMSGAKYTSYFSKHNHAIVCRTTASAQDTSGSGKMKKAKEWGVPTVSVQWLNEVLFGGVTGAQCLKNPRFQNFKMEDPFRIDYTMVPSLISAWKHPIRVTPERYQKFSSNPPIRHKRKADRLKAEEEDRAKRLKLMQGSQPQQPAPLDNNNTKMATPAEQPATTTESTPVTGSSGAINGVEGSASGSPESSADKSSTPSSDSPKAHENGGSANGVHDTNGGSSEKDGEGSVSGPKRIIFTGFTATTLAEMERMARDLGAEVMSSQSTTGGATHLVMPKLGRTIKFLCALSSVSHVLSPQWIQDSHKDKKFKDEGAYELHDEKFEDQFSFDLKASLQTKNRDKLFEGKTFYLTPTVEPSWKKLKLVVESHGGTVDTKRRKDVAQIKELNVRHDDPKYIIISCEHDLHLVTDVLLAKIGIFNAEFVMSSVMKGRMDFDLTKSLTTVR